MWALPAREKRHQSLSALAVNSGPFSQRKNCGARPRTDDEVITGLHQALRAGSRRTGRVLARPASPLRPDQGTRGPPDDRFVYLSDALPTAWQAVEYADVPEGRTAARQSCPTGDADRRHRPPERNPHGDRARPTRRHRLALRRLRRRSEPNATTADVSTSRSTCAWAKRRQALDRREILQKKQDGAFKVLLRPNERAVWDGRVQSTRCRT